MTFTSNKVPQFIGPQIVSVFNNLLSLILWEGNRFLSTSYKLFDKDIVTLINIITDENSVPTNEILHELTKESPSGNKRVSSYSIFNSLIQIMKDKEDLLNYIEFLRENSPKFLHTLPDSLFNFKHYLRKLQRYIFHPKKFHKKKITEDLLLIYIRDIIIILEICRLITVDNLINKGCSINVNRLIEDSRLLINLFD